MLLNTTPATTDTTHADQYVAAAVDMYRAAGDSNWTARADAQGRMARAARAATRAGVDLDTGALTGQALATIRAERATA